MKKQFDAFEAALAHLQYILIARRVQASDESMRLNWKHFDIMAFIKNHGPAAPSAISEALTISRSSISKYLKYLERQGLLSRAANGPDGRSHLVSLTELANSILENIYKGQHNNAVQAKQVLTPDEMNQFTTIANKIASTLDSDELRTV